MEFGVAFVAAAVRSAVSRARVRRALRLLIEFSKHALNVARKFFGGFYDTVVIVGGKFFLGFLNRAFNGGFIFFGEFVAAVFNRLFYLEDKRVEFVLVLNGLFSLLIFFLVSLRLFNGLVYIFFRKVGRRSNRYIGGFLSAEVFRRYVNDTVGVDIESNFDLRYSSRSGSNTRKVELTESLVVFCELSFALKNVNGNFGLVIRRGGEHLRFLYGDSRVSVDKFGEHAAESFYTEGQRSYVEK